jgi:streptogramin lyase
MSLLLIPAAIATAQVTITEFLVPTSGSQPGAITAGPDGNLWFTESAGNNIGRITPAGVVTEFPIPTANSGPDGITVGPDGALWFTEENANKIGRITTTGAISEFQAPPGALSGVATGADGALWFTGYESANIGRVTTSGAFSSYPVPGYSVGASSIVAGPDGALWFTANLDSAIGRITTSGAVTEFPLVAPSSPGGIAVGPDGALWFAEVNGKIGRITVAGAIAEYPIATGGGQPGALAAGSDGALWFTDYSNLIGRITTSGAITEYPAPSTSNGIAAGPDGATWFTEGNANKIARAVIPPAAPPYIQQGGKLVGTGGVGQSAQGVAVAISADGSTAIVGGADDNNSGAAWVYTRTNGVWSQQGAKLVGTGASGPSAQGSAVALSGDGNTALIGAPDDNSYAGAAWVFTRTNGLWSQNGAKLVGSGGVGASWQGSSVALSFDGMTAAIGALNDSPTTGAVWVFTNTGGAWTQQGAKLVPTGGIGGPVLGSAVSLSADGNTLLAGGFNDNTGVGAAWIFTRSGGVWTQQAKLVGAGGIGEQRQGLSVSLSSDGNTAIVGGPLDNGSVGAVWIFTWTNGVWSQQGSKLVGVGGVGLQNQGCAVSLSGDGNTALVGGYSDNNVGAVWVYTRSGGVWTELGSKLVATGGTPTGSSQGQSVALSRNANAAIVGGPSDSAAGAAWTYVIAPPVWSTGVYGQISSIAGNGNLGFSGDGGPAIWAEFSDTNEDVALDGRRNLYIADRNNQRVRRVDAITGIITSVAGNGLVGFLGDGGPATSAILQNPYGLVLDTTGNLYIADFSNSRVRRVDVTTGIITTVAGIANVGHGSGDGGPATSAAMGSPSGVAFDAAGNLYIADSYYNVVRRVDAVSGIITTVAGTGSSGYSGDGGPATSAQLNFPRSVASDASGNLYIADSDNQRIRRVDANTGVITTVAGTGTGGYNGDGGSAVSAEIWNPSGVTLDSAGNLFIADSGNQRIRQVDAVTGIITTVAGGGSAFYGDGGPAIAATLEVPNGVAVDDSGNIYISDEFIDRIRYVDFSNGPPAATLTGLTISPSTLAGGTLALATLTLTLSGAAPAGGATIDLSGANPFPVTNSFQIPAGQSSGSFQAEAFSVTVDTAVTVTASYKGVNETATVTVTPPPSPDGVVTVASVYAAPGGSFSIPITLTMNGTKTANNVTFGLQIVPVGAAPALTTALGFTSAIPGTPTVSNGGMLNEIGVVWTSLTTSIGGAQLLGNVTGTLPAGSAAGNSYTIQIYGAGAAQGNSAYSITFGGAATLTVADTYLVGDVYPFTSDCAPNFGDGVINILDLTAVLFAVDNIPGYAPAAGSDRWDAMDLYPPDTPTVRGGDGVLDIRDLVLELFRANNLDLARPVRTSRGACSGTSNTGAGSALRRSAQSQVPRATLSLGGPGGTDERIPLHLQADQDLNGIAVTFGLGDQHSPLHFVPAAGLPPSLVSDDKPGTVAAAWLEGLSLRARERLLLGYVSGPAGALRNLTVYGLSASVLGTGQEIHLDMTNFSRPPGGQ